MLVVTVLSLFAVDLGQPRPGLAKEFDVDGTVDCGIPSGRRCDLGDTLVLLTDSVSGQRELVPIDIRGIKRKLPALDQDDEITLCVEMLPDGKLKAQCVISAKRRDGTLNQGASTGSVDVFESRRDRGLEQDKDENQVTVAQPGALSGTVRSLIGGAPIPGATVAVNGFTGTTDANGAFAIASILPGTYQAIASAPGFISQTLPVTIQTSQQPVQLNFLLATAFADLNFSLAWGSRPADLDAHLSGPATVSPPPRFHAFFLALNPEPYVSHTGDDSDGFGPERIVVTRNGGQYVAGEYRFWADNPNLIVEGNFTGSQARVVVNLGSQLLGVFDVANAAGDPNLPLWHVVNVTLDAAGNATVVPVQQFTAGSPVTVLSTPYGGGKPRRR